jgi:multiple sugar transport system permease protein
LPTEIVRRRRRGQRGRRTAFLVLVYAAALGTAVVILAPFGWLLISSVASPADLLARPLKWIPSHVSLARYESIFRPGTNDSAAAFRAGVVNSAVVAASTVAISLAVGVFGAYAFARLRFRFQRAVLLLFLSTYMLPPIAIVIPLYLILVRLHLLDTRVGLIVVYCSFVTPFVLWILSGHFRAIPADLEDAARIDGCTRLGALFRVILPIARPGLLATVLFGFLIAWDEFLYALIFTSSTASKTIPVAIAEFQGRFTVDFGLVAAGGILASIPPLAIAFVFQRYIVSGLASGAVKG